MNVQASRNTYKKMKNLFISSSTIINNSDNLNDENLKFDEELGGIG